MLVTPPPPPFANLSDASAAASSSLTPPLNRTVAHSPPPHSTLRHLIACNVTVTLCDLGVRAVPNQDTAAGGKQGEGILDSGGGQVFGLVVLLHPPPPRPRSCQRPEGWPLSREICLDRPEPGPKTTSWECLMWAGHYPPRFPPAFFSFWQSVVVLS